MNNLLVFLLQTSALEARQNPRYLKVFFGILLIIVPIVIVNQFVSSFKRRFPTQHHSSERVPATFSQIKRAARSYGFTLDQIRFFEQLCKVYKIHNPDFYFQNEDAADILFKKVFQTLTDTSASAATVENTKMMIFSIRQALENFKRASRSTISTKSLRRGLKLYIQAKILDQTICELLENTPSGFAVSIPRDADEVEVRLPVFSKVFLFFQSDSGIAYEFATRVLRYDYQATVTRMMLAHNNKLPPLHTRVSKRKEMERPCYVRNVQVADGKTSNSKKNYITLNQKFRSTVQDISGGGCSVKTNAQIPAGKIIHIEMQLVNRRTDEVFGKVVRTSIPEGERGTILHVQFLRMKKSTRNLIYSLVYDY